LVLIPPSPYPYAPNCVIEYRNNKADRIVNIGERHIFVRLILGFITLARIRIAGVVILSAMGFTKPPIPIPPNN